MDLVQRSQQMLIDETRMRHSFAGTPLPNIDAPAMQRPETGPVQLQKAARTWQVHLTPGGRRPGSGPAGMGLAAQPARPT